MKFKIQKKISLFFLSLIICSLPFNYYAKIKNDTIKIVSWNIQMIPKIYAPFTKLARKKQKVRTPKIIKHVIFDVSKKSDKGAQKGCSLVEIKINNKKLLLGGTHLDSKSPESRSLQYKLIAENITKPFLNDSVPLLLAGDFNTNFNTAEYDSMMVNLKLNNYELNDDRPYTFDEFNTWNSKGYKSWIDYIFYQKSRRIKILDQYVLRPVMKFKKSKMDLADHYQLVLEIVIR